MTTDDFSQAGMFDISPDKLPEADRTGVFQVIRSRFAMPNERYLTKGPNVMQWQLELKPLSFRYDDDSTDSRQCNLFPNEDNYQRYLESKDAKLMVGQKSALALLSGAFKAIGVPVSGDPTVLEGRIFEFELKEVTLGGNKKWMQIPLRELQEYTPPATLNTVRRNRKTDDAMTTDPLSDTAGATSSLTPEQAVDLAVSKLANIPAGSETVVLSQIPELMQEPWMSQVVSNQLLQACYASGKLALVDGVNRLLVG